VEHGSLTPSAVAVDLENLFSTYEVLAEAIGAERVRSDNFTAFTHPNGHSIGNCAFRVSLEPQTLARLATLAGTQAGFHVYDPVETSAGGLEAETRQEMLRRAGFQRQFSLMRFSAPEGFDAMPVQLVEVASPADRRKVASFMTEQFFGRDKTEFRETVTRATSGAGRLRLAITGSMSDIRGAVMVCDQPEAFGIYNLAVRPDCRRRGIGRGILQTLWHTVRATPGDRRQIVLQSDPSLAVWYRDLGFRELGHLEAYVLDASLRN